MTYPITIGQTILGDNQPDSDFVPVTYQLTTDHAASSYGVPVLVSPDGVAYGPEDILPLRGDKAKHAVEWAILGGDADDATFSALQHAAAKFGCGFRA